MKKILSILLTLILTALVLSPVGAVAETAEADGCDCGQTPIVYIRGRATIIKDKNLPIDEENGTNPGLPYIEEAKLKAVLEEVVPIYAECYVKDDFTAFKEIMTLRFKEIYADYALDTNGNIPNNSGLPVEDDWKNKTFIDNHKPNGDVDTPQECMTELYKYFYQYDCRLDPCDTADDLHLFIQKIKEVTGHKKVKILARCLGTNILSAYIAEYGYEDFEDVVLYNAITNGTAITNSLFNGELYFDADAVDFFATQNLTGEMTILDFICEVITVANKTYGLDILMDYFNMTATEVARFVVPDIMRVSYATTPGYWSMVSADQYEAARDYIFEGVEEEWAGLIEKIDNYHYTVGVKLNDLYKQMEADGVNVYNISKYGYQLYPIMKDAARQSDTIVTVEQQAPGTISAPLGKKLSVEYVEQAKAEGTYKYISPDKCIDSSKSLFPDTTWYIKNLDHNKFPWVVDKLIYTILRSDGEMTVFSDENYPQYMDYAGNDGKEHTNDAVLKPITEEDPGFSIEQPSFKELLKNLVENYIKLIRELIDTVIAKIKESTPQPLQ